MPFTIRTLPDLARRFRRAAAAACLLSAASGFAAQAPPEDAAYAADETGRTIADLVQAYESVGFTGAVLAAKDGRVVAAVGVGSADPDGRDPITPSTLFEIASITKPFTAVAVMRLVQEGQLGLDDPISKHLPGVPEDCAAITIRHLLQHTSGIPGTNSQGAGDDLSVVLPVFLKGGPQHEPGTHWEYWNQGYSLLSEIIARASDESYTDYCREAIFVPAGMTHSLFTGDAAPQGASVAVGQSGRGAPRSALEHPYGSYGFQYRGMGGLVTSVWDLWRWDRALVGTKLLNEASKKEMFTPGEGSYGLGWFILKNKRGRLMQSHNGGVRGFACEVRRYPEQDAAVFVLCSRDDVPVWRIADAVEGVLFGDEGAGPKPPKPLDKELGAEIAGRYVDERENVLVVEPDGPLTRAQVQWKSYPPTRALLGADDDGEVVFYEWTNSMELEVQRDGGGVVTGLSIVSGERRTDYRRVATRGDAAPEPAPAPPPPAGEPPDWAAPLLGHYKDAKDIELVVAMSGRMVTAQIHWSPQGPITYARLERKESGEIEFVEFSRSPSKYPIEVTRDDAEEVTRISIVAGERRQDFDRVEAQPDQPEK